MGCLTDAVISLLKHSEDCTQCSPIILRKVFTEEFLSWAVYPSSQFFSELGYCQNSILNEIKEDTKEEIGEEIKVEIKDIKVQETKAGPKEEITEELTTNFIEDYVAISPGSDFEVESVTEIFDISLDNVSSDSDLLHEESVTTNPEFHITFEDITFIQDKSVSHILSEEEYVPDIDKSEELYCTIDNFNNRSVSISNSSSPDIKYQDDENEELYCTIDNLNNRSVLVTSLASVDAKDDKNEELYSTIGKFNNKSLSVSSLSSVDVKDDESEPVIGLRFIIRNEVFTTIDSKIWCNLCETQIKLRQQNGLKNHVTSLFHSNNVLKKVYNEVFPETMDTECFPLYLSTIRMYQEKELKEEDDLAKLFRDYINNKFSNLVDKLNKGITGCPETEDIRFDMRKGFMKVFGVVDIVHGKNCTILRGSKKVYLILREPPMYLSEQVGIEVWVAGNVSKNGAALIMTVKSWGRVQCCEEKVVVTTQCTDILHEERGRHDREKMIKPVEVDRTTRTVVDDTDRNLKGSGKENRNFMCREDDLNKSSRSMEESGNNSSRSMEESGNKRISGDFDKRKSGVKESTIQATICYPLTTTTKLHNHKGSHVAVRGRITGHSVIGKALILADFSDQFGSCQVTLRGGKCTQIQDMTDCKCLLIEGKCYDIRNKSGKIELVLDQWTPVLEQNMCTNHVANTPCSGVATRKRTPQSSSVRTERRMNQDTVFPSYDVRYKQSVMLDASDVRYRLSSSFESNDGRERPSKVLDTSDVRYRRSSSCDDNDVRYKPSGILETSMVRYKPSGPTLDMPDLIPLPSISKDKVMQDIDQDYAPIVFVDNLHHYVGRKVVTWGVLTNFRTEGSGKRASIGRSGMSIEVQFPRSMTVSHGSKSLAVVVEGFVRREGTTIIMDVVYTEPVGEMVSTLAFQARSVINVKYANYMPTCQLSDLSLHLGKHVVLNTKINDIFIRSSRGSKELISGEFEDRETICRFRIVCFFDRYKSFKPTDQVCAVVKVDNTMKPGQTLPPGVSVEYMALHQATDPEDPMDSATAAIANALKQMVLTGVNELKASYRHK